VETRFSETAAEVQYEKWNHWPVNWSAIWIGSLAALAAVLVIGLIGVALGAHVSTPEHRWVDLRKLSIGALIFSICGAFFSFVIGGWVAGKVAGILRSEPAMLHGAITWLVAVPLLLALCALGAASFFGGWYGGLSGTPAWAPAASLPFDRPEALSAGATQEEQAQYRAALADYEAKVHQWREDTPKVTRNAALGAVTALLLGLVGSVIGGWLASGEPMNFTHFRTRRTFAPRSV
jgi:uncharacterized membrane protein YeaQ/YmgE (transglycosylase-associated protein family)